MPIAIQVVYVTMTAFTRKHGGKHSTEVGLDCVVLGSRVTISQTLSQKLNKREMGVF